MRTYRIKYETFDAFRDRLDTSDETRFVVPTSRNWKVGDTISIRRGQSKNAPHENVEILEEYDLPPNTEGRVSQSLLVRRKAA